MQEKWLGGWPNRSWHVLCWYVNLQDVQCGIVLFFFSIKKNGLAVGLIFTHLLVDAQNIVPLSAVFYFIFYALLFV